MTNNKYDQIFRNHGPNLVTNHGPNMFGDKYDQNLEFSEIMAENASDCTILNDRSQKWRKGGRGGEERNWPAGWQRGEKSGTAPGYDAKLALPAD